MLSYSRSSHETKLSRSEEVLRGLMPINHTYIMTPNSLYAIFLLYEAVTRDYKPHEKKPGDNAYCSLTDVSRSGMYENGQSVKQ